MLAFSPLLYETDLSAASHVSFISETLRVFQEIRDVQFLVADNAAVNQKIARDLDIVLIGCGCHRLNLATNSYLKNFEPLLQKVNDIIKKLSSLKRGALLRKVTNLRLVISNVISYQMNINVRYADRAS